MSGKIHALTTGEAAALCGVCVGTVAVWCDDKGLGHYRLPGRRGDRRIPASELVEWLEDQGMIDAFKHADELDALRDGSGRVQWIPGGWVGR